MITNEQRERLSGLILRPRDCEGFDCEGAKLQRGDRVEVARADPARANEPGYNYCAERKQGTVVEHSGGWIVVVDFGENRTIGCVDTHLRKL